MVVLPSTNCQAWVTLEINGLDRCSSVAGDGSHGGSRVVNSFAEKVQKELGVLAFSLEQCAVDYMGLARSCVRADLPATMSRFP